MANLEDAAHFLRGADKILILSHRSPDGDTLGCASALSRALIALGKSVMFRCADPVPPKFTYLFEGIEYGEFEPEHIVTVDVADKTLLGSLEPYYTWQNNKIFFDGLLYESHNRAKLIDHN